MLNLKKKFHLKNEKIIPADQPDKQFLQDLLNNNDRKLNLKSKNANCFTMKNPINKSEEDRKKIISNELKE